MYTDDFAFLIDARCGSVLSAIFTEAMHYARSFRTHLTDRFIC